MRYPDTLLSDAPLWPNDLPEISWSVDLPEISLEQGASAPVITALTFLSLVILFFA